MKKLYFDATVLVLPFIPAFYSKSKYSKFPNPDLHGTSTGPSSMTSWGKMMRRSGVFAERRS